MTPEEDEEFERIAQKQLAALKKATKATTEDAAVRAVHKVMAEYPDNFIDALKYDVAKRDSEAQQAYEDAIVGGTGVMLGDKRIDPASIYKEPEQDLDAPLTLNGVALYPKREWQGLTDDEIALINADYPHPQGFAKAIEAKLKEKNT